MSSDFVLEISVTWKSVLITLQCIYYPACPVNCLLFFYLKTVSAFTPGYTISTYNQVLIGSYFVIQEVKHFSCHAFKRSINLFSSLCANYTIYLKIAIQGYGCLTIIQLYSGGQFNRLKPEYPEKNIRIWIKSRKSFIEYALLFRESN